MTSASRLGLVVWLLVPGAVAAQDVPSQETEQDVTPAARAPSNVVEARERVARGEALFERGDYDAALAEFEAAYDVIGAHPSRYLVLYNIGQCHEREFRYDVAQRYYRRYLEEGDASDAAEVEAQIASLESLLATVRITTNVPGAEVWVDEREVGAAPGAVRIPAGLHVLELRAVGYLPARRSIQLPAGEEVDAAISLERLSEEFEGLHPAFFITTASMAAAALGAGIGLGLTAVGDRNTLDDRLADPSDRWNVTQGEIDAVGDLALGADVSFAVAALFGVGATVLALLTDWEGDEEETVNEGVAIEVAAHPFGATVGARGSL